MTPNQMCCGVRHVRICSTVRHHTILYHAAYDNHVVLDNANCTRHVHFHTTGLHRSCTKHLLHNTRRWYWLSQILFLRVSCGCVVQGFHPSFGCHVVAHLEIVLFELHTYICGITLIQRIVNCYVNVHLITNTPVHWPVLHHYPFIVYIPPHVLWCVVAHLSVCQGKFWRYGWLGNGRTQSPFMSFLLLFVQLKPITKPHLSLCWLLLEHLRHSWLTKRFSQNGFS